MAKKLPEASGGRKAHGEWETDSALSAAAEYRAWFESRCGATENERQLRIQPPLNQDRF